MRFQIKSTMYSKGRPRQVDGPWKASFEEALTAYAGRLRQRGMTESLIFHAFVAEEAPKDEAEASDGKVFYNTNKELTKSLAARLQQEGLKPYVQASR